MFGRSLLRDLEDDPFFSGFNSHKDMFDSMGFFRDPFMALEDGRNERKEGRKITDRDQRMADPFGGIFQSMNAMMSDMHKRMSEMHVPDSSDPNVHSLSSTTVMSYRNDGKSDPKIYQASKSTRRAPGQIKETRRAVRDSETGLEKMSVGHHIGERGKVVERRRNLKAGGQMEEERNFLHIGEDQEQEFDREWRDKTSKFDLGFRSKAKPTEIGGGRPRDRNEQRKEREPRRRAIGTPAAAPRGPTPARPHGPSHSGRARSKY